MQKPTKNNMQKITPCLWFDNKAEEAVNLYISLFKNSKILDTARYDKESAKVSGMPEGMVLTISFELDGQKFLALNGGPLFKFTEAISLTIDCKDQKEVDHFWNNLTKDGGEESQCGWLKDKFGLSWQVVPIILPKLLTDKDTKKAQRTMKAMLTMKKLDVAKLEKAASGK
jgi:predicted 3-demethylubiquinone-9 3-methyltransferase (glyoxalase superfamily)